MTKTLAMLKREFEQLLDQFCEVMRRNGGNKERQEWKNCYYFHPNFRQIASLQKRVSALADVDPALSNALVPVMAQITFKSSEIMLASISAENAKKAKIAARAAKAKDVEETKADPYRKLHPLVAEMLRKVAEPYRLKAHAESMARQRAFIEIMRAAAAVCGSFNPLRMFPTNANRRDANRLQQEAYVYVSMEDTEWKLYASDEFLTERANKFAESLVSSFVYKVGMKLSGIVERKGDLATNYVSGDLQDHWMTFIFCDGSSFQVQSQIVWVWNSHGTNFTRYPTCFRNVKMKDGSKMIKPSEAKMRKEFV